MPKIEPEWALNKEADDMIAKLVDMYPDKFAHIDPTTVGCAMIVNKEPPQTQRWDAKIGGVKAPESLWSKKIYCIQFYKKTWDEYDETHRSVMLFRLLERIPEDLDGKVDPVSLQDSYSLVKAFGPDYMNNPALPNLLSEKQIFGESKPQADTAGA